MYKHTPVLDKNLLATFSQVHLNTHSHTHVYNTFIIIICYVPLIYYVIHTHK